MTRFRPYHWVGRLLKLLRKAGVDIQPLITRDKRIAGARVRWREEEPGVLRGAIVDTVVERRPMRLFVQNDVDVIQQQHRAGALYEPEELAMIAAEWRGGTFLDVGANIGNHTLYAAIVLQATKVIAVEPHELAANILETNVALNHVSQRVAVHRVGLSASSGRAAASVQSNNLGATRLTESEEGIELVRGDTLVGDEIIDFIKIDTEGFELRVLEGLIETITRDAPPMLVEVEVHNLAAFEQFCHVHNYVIGRRFQRYPTSVNCLATQSDQR